ncbi:hypothetical protein CJF31_00006040 [Rutstroemia sp. NJR-2017a BVV2]|nr:hypothetical protein CJF31_00006040 [Rutstroemia sp. NJR-2017a BVV2]
MTRAKVHAEVHNEAQFPSVLAIVRSQPSRLRSR